MSLINDILVEKFIADQFGRMQPVERLLDLGCGPRPYRVHYASVARHAIGGDYSSRPGIDLRLSATALPFEDGAFDVVLCTEVLEHVDDADRAVREIARVLRTGGKVLLTLPFNYMVHEVPNDHVRYTLFGLVSLLSRHGLQVSVVRQRGSLLTLMVAQTEFLLRGSFEALRRLPIISTLLRPLGWAAAGIWRRIVVALWRKDHAGDFHDPAELLASPPHSRRLKGPIGQLRHWSLGFCLVANRSDAQLVTFR